MTTGAPRIRPGGRGDVGLFTWGLAKVSGRVTGTEPPNLFLTLGRHRTLFRGWLRFAGRLMPGGTLPRRETELVILRVAHLRGCRYEFDHHVALGARAGVSEADVERVVAGPDGDGWTARERLLLTAADDLHHRHDLTDETWRHVLAELSETGAIELVLLVTHYEMLATTIGALRIQPDRPRHRTGSGPLRRTAFRAGAEPGPGWRRARRKGYRPGSPRSGRAPRPSRPPGPWRAPAP